MGDILSAYVMRGAHWWWLIVARAGVEDARLCTFGSLLPYLLGRAPHIVHRPGACAICEALDPAIWRDTEALIAEALADPRVRSLPVADLPMKPIPVADVERIDEPEFFHWLVSQRKGTIYGVLEEGVFIGVAIEQTKTMGGLGSLSEIPSF